MTGPDRQIEKVRALKANELAIFRVSSFEQNTDRQLDGVEFDRVFADKASGKGTKRPQLEALLAFVRDGDTLVVHSMDRLARNLDDLRQIVQSLTARGARIEFVKERLLFTGEDSPMASLMFSVMGAFAGFEGALIRERQPERVPLAKQRYAYRGQKKALSTEQGSEVRHRAATGENEAEIARSKGNSRETLNQHLRAVG